jgi:hypothetical protein
MCKESHIILGIHINDRVHRVPPVQQIFTEFGCNIKTRIGLHDVDGNYCSPNGLIILELVGELTRCQLFIDKLKSLEGVDVKQMLFEHK